MPAEPTPEERTFAMIAHISGCFTWVVGPLLIYVLKQDSPYVKYQAMQALIYHGVAGMIFNVIVGATFGLGCPLVVVFWGIAAWVAIAKANKGLWDGYPAIGQIGMPPEG